MGDIDKPTFEKEKEFVSDERLSDEGRKILLISFSYPETSACTDGNIA